MVVVVVVMGSRIRVRSMTSSERMKVNESRKGEDGWMTFLSLHLAFGGDVLLVVNEESIMS